MRKVIITESQLKYILREFDTYLSNANDALGHPGNAYGTEIGTTQQPTDPNAPNKKSERANNPGLIGDKEGNIRQRRPFAGQFHTYPNTTIFEANQDFDGKNFNMDSTIKQKTDTLVGANPEEQGGIFDTTDNMTANSAYKKIHDINQMKDSDPQRYAKMNGKGVVKNLKKQINLAKDNSKRKKEINKQNGVENTYQQAGGTKQANNGKAHSKKNMANVIFTYGNT